MKTEWVTAENAAKILGVSRETVRHMIEDGRLQPMTLVNGRIAVFATDYLYKIKPKLVIHHKGTRRTKARQEVAA